MRPHGIIIDLDHTLFDATAFKATLAASVLKCGVSRDVFLETYTQIRASDKHSEYSPNKHLAALGKIINLDQTSAKKSIDKVVSHSQKYLYSDALTFLKKISSLGVPFILLSCGDRDFQQKKISACGIKKYFTEIKIVQKSKNAVMKKLAKKYGGNLIFINDNIKETREAIKEIVNIQPILKRRSDLPIHDYTKETIPNFHTLKEIENYILWKINPKNAV